MIKYDISRSFNYPFIYISETEIGKVAIEYLIDNKELHPTAMPTFIEMIEDEMKKNPNSPDFFTSDIIDKTGNKVQVHYVTLDKLESISERLKDDIIYTFFFNLGVKAIFLNPHL